MSPAEDRLARMLLQANFPNMRFGSLVHCFETGDRSLFAQEEGKDDVWFDGLDKVSSFIAGSLWN